LEKFSPDHEIKIVRRSLHMAVTLSEYDLPDAFLFREGTTGYLVWQPEEPVIVLGQSNSIESSLYQDAVTADGLRVTKRPSGGETVILTPSTIAFTVAKRFPVMIPFKEYFQMVNRVVVAGLEGLGVSRLGSKGISDITIGNRKILGSSMRKVHDKLVYHAVLNLGEDPALFGRYLLHPRREPDYRAGRSHSEFVTSMADEGYRFTAEEVMAMLDRRLAELMVSHPAVI
jgi:lipoate-protein ligase A